MDTFPAIKPMLASPANGMKIEQLQGTHFYDIKLDGVRALFYWDGHAAKIVNRSGRDRTDVYPDLVAGCPRPTWSYVLDGEIVAATGKFSDIARRDKQTKYADVNRVMREIPAQFIAFDVLYLDSGDTRSQSFFDRRMMLDGLAMTWDQSLPFTSSVISQDPGFFEVVRQQGMEGVIAKRLKSTYRAGRFSDWVKFKTTQSITAIATGYEPGTGARAHFGAMFLHVIEDGKLVPVGKVGTGFTAKEITVLKTALDSGVALVVEIECLNVSKDGILRFPVYKGRRTDLSYQDATLDQLDNIPRC